MMEELIEALRPFAAMDRRSGDLKEIVCIRGMPSIGTLLTNGDFRRAHEIVKKYAVCNCEDCECRRDYEDEKHEGE